MNLFPEYADPDKDITTPKDGPFQLVRLIYVDERTRSGEFVEVKTNRPVIEQRHERPTGPLVASDEGREDEYRRKREEIAATVSNYAGTVDYGTILEQIKNFPYMPQGYRWMFDQMNTHAGTIMRTTVVKDDNVPSGWYFEVQELKGNITSDAWKNVGGRKWVDGKWTNF